MCLFSRLFSCNNCNRCCRSSLCQNVRMRYVDAGGDYNCERQNSYSGCGCGCHRHDSYEENCRD